MARTMSEFRSSDVSQKFSDACLVCARRVPSHPEYPNIIMRSPISIFHHSFRHFIKINILIQITMPAVAARA